MIVTIESDEWYPVHSIQNRSGTSCDVPTETVARWKRVTAEFHAVQQEMGEALKNEKEKQCS